MYEKEIANAVKSAYNMANSVKNAKIMKEINNSSIKSLEKICLVNDKLDMFLRTSENIFWGKLRAANLALEDISNSNAFTESNIQILKQLYMSNIGLPLDETTYLCNNNDIVAYSYLGLILLENYTTQNDVLIFRYAMRMFEANCIIAKEYFPEMYCEYFEEAVIRYERQELDLITYHRIQMLNLNEKIYRDIADLIIFYDLSIQVTDWREGAENPKDKLFGVALNKIIGPVEITAANCRKIFLIICACSSEQNYFSYSVVKILGDLVCTFVKVKFNSSFYRDKRQIRVARLLAKEYLK